MRIAAIFLLSLCYASAAAQWRTSWQQDSSASTIAYSVTLPGLANFKQFLYYEKPFTNRFGLAIEASNFTRFRDTTNASTRINRLNLSTLLTLRSSKLLPHFCSYAGLGLSFLGSPYSTSGTPLPPITGSRLRIYVEVGARSNIMLSSALFFNASVSFHQYFLPSVQYGLSESSLDVISLAFGIGLII